MKLKLFVLSGVLFCWLNLFAQNNYEDVVYLKNGSIIHGIIIEQIPNVSIKIKSGPNIFVYKMEEIEKFTKEEVKRSSGGGGGGNMVSGDYGFGASKYAGNIEIGLSDYPKGENIPMFAIMIVNGYRFNPNVTLGFGVGAEVSGKNVHNFPIFGDLRGYFTKSRVAPFGNFQLGYNVMSAGRAFHGFMISPAFGVRIAINQKIAGTFSLGYKFIGSGMGAVGANELGASHGVTLRFGIAL